MQRVLEQMLYYEDIKVRGKRSGEATSKYTSQALSEPLTRWRAPAPSQSSVVNLLLIAPKSYYIYAVGLLGLVPNSNT